LKQKQTKKQQIFFYKLEKQSDTMESCFQGHAILYDTMQYNAIQCNTKVYCIKYIYIHLFMHSFRHFFVRMKFLSKNPNAFVHYL